MGKHFAIIFLLAGLAGCGGNSRSAADTNPAPDGNEDYISRYSVINNDLSLNLEYGGSNQQQERALWQAVIDLLPNDIIKAEIANFIVFTDGEADTLAYVEQIPSNSDKWNFALDPEDSSDTSSAEFVSTLIHEFGHIVALENDQVTPGVSAAQCTTAYPIVEGCPTSNAYILAWFKAFWQGALMDEHQRKIGDNPNAYDQIEDFYQLHSSKFISEYSATNPVEDFAEVFKQFVLSDKIAAPLNMKQEKINFFFNYPVLKAIRDQIRNKTNIRLENL